MTREIKFRAKALDKQYGLVYFDLSEIGNWDDSCNVFYAKEIPCEINSIQQYIGLKDKNGKEVYCSDLVKVFVPQNLGEDKKAIGVVEWCDDGYWQIDFPNYGQSIGIWGCVEEDYDIKVIGNIYKNPEFLKR